MSQNFKAGELFIDAIALVNQEGESVDISKLIIGMQMYESIYKKFCSAEILLLDSLNILKYYKVTGQEYVRVSLRQKEGTDDASADEFSIDKTFRLYKVENVQRPQELIQTYSLKLCDPRLFYSRRKRISAVMRGSYDEMLQRVLLETAFFKPDEFDLWTKTSPQNYQFISPNWTVNSLIDYFVSNSSIEQPAYRNGMFFFQTLNGGFRFSDISEMFAREFPITFSFKPRNSDVSTADQDINSETGLNTQIIRYEKEVLCDTLSGTINGAYASQMMVYDPVRKIEENIYYDMEETFSRGDHVSGFPMVRTEIDERSLTTENMVDKAISPSVTEVDIDLPINKHYDSLVVYGCNMVHAFDDGPITEASTFRGIEDKQNEKLERMALLEILQQHKIQVTIPFRSDLSVGTVIVLDIPEPELYNGQDAVDEINDNRYLITDMAIEVQPLEYTGFCHLECVKESYALKVQDQIPLDDSPNPKQV